MQLMNMAGSMQNEAETEPMTQERFGRFYLQELLNSGGMADIWVVTDGRGKPYALRKLKKELRFNLLARRRFLQGCEVLSKINESDYVVGYVEHGRQNGTLYLLMDYVEAVNLKELFARQDPVLTENVAQILIDMALGLECNRNRHSRLLRAPGAGRGSAQAQGVCQPRRNADCPVPERQLPCPTAALSGPLAGARGGRTCAGEAAGPLPSAAQLAQCNYCLRFRQLGGGARPLIPDSWDPGYTALTETADPGQDPQRGGLLVAHPGKGTYIYVAFALYRQFPELVPGAYRLMANLLSAGYDNAGNRGQTQATNP